MCTVPTTFLTGRRPLPYIHAKRRKTKLFQGPSFCIRMVNYSHAHNWVIRVHALSPINRSLDAWPPGHWPSWISSIPASAYTTWPRGHFPELHTSRQGGARAPLFPKLASIPCPLCHQGLVEQILAGMTTICPRHRPLLIHDLSLGLLEKPDPRRTNYQNRQSSCTSETWFLIFSFFSLSQYFKQRPCFSPTQTTSSCDQNFWRIVILNEKGRTASLVKTITLPCCPGSVFREALLLNCHFQSSLRPQHISGGRGGILMEGDKE